MKERLAALVLVTLLAACGGGAGGDGGTPIGGCAGACASVPQSITIAEVQQVIRQAAQEAAARGAPATIAVVDRTGNVLAVFQMPGAPPTVLITSGTGAMGGLENVPIVLSQFAAISKAITGAYLSTEGNAFSTRTASQIVQQNFNPEQANQPGGPLFGVQFSSLSCSDVARSAAFGTAGPKGSPLGLAADPGGLPLYKNGTVVGGVGIIADGVYGLDQNIITDDTNLDDELIAVAGTRGFDAPPDRRAERILVDGRTLRYVDAETLASNPAAAPAFAATPGVLLAVPGYNPGVIAPGTTYQTPASGIRPNADPAFVNTDSFVLDNGAGVNRYPPIAGTDGMLTQPEVTRILIEAITVANRTRAQIRRPVGAPAQVSMTVVDTNGVILGIVRTPDAPIFGIDVSVQKARSALFFSLPTAAAELTAHPPNLITPPLMPIGTYVALMQGFIPGAFTDGIAYTPRTIGNVARPFFPDGINGNPPGPLSKPAGSWSPFNDGLQLDLVINRVVANILAPAGPTPPCTQLARVPNGIQIFAGGVPIYRGNTIVGGIGVSGDGIDQDDMIAFLGLANAGVVLNTGIAHAPAARRADQIPGLPGGRLRYVSCPLAPFIDNNPTTNVCDAL